MRDGNTKRSVKTVSLCAPGMSDNLAVKVRYGLGSGNVNVGSTYDKGDRSYQVRSDGYTYW